MSAAATTTFHVGRLIAICQLLIASLFPQPADLYCAHPYVVGEYMSLPAMRAVESENEKPAGEDFHALEEKIYKAIELLKSARDAKAAAERDANRLRDQLEQREEELEVVRSEVVSLRKEREEVRGRVEKMLKQIDALVEQG